MPPFFSFGPVPSTRSVYLPGLVLRLTPANAYQQWHDWLTRKDKACPRKLPVSAVSCFGAVTRNNTGEPFTSFTGSHCALHAPGGRAPARILLTASRKHTIGSCRKKSNMSFIADGWLHTLPACGKGYQCDQCKSVARFMIPSTS